MAMQIPDPVNVAQRNWRFCGKCRSLFYNEGSRGVCPAGGEHDPKGWDIYLLADPENVVE
jgi:hypothetical protein